MYVHIYTYTYTYICIQASPASPAGPASAAKFHRTVHWPGKHGFLNAYPLDGMRQLSRLDCL